ncbi:hypothetical protein [Hymenobacter cheonanensis]|uniref:hypothetical protein n=1 Tax=Hymenobacter sp. CA2-7 TaxID=3063993 RepID=UPI002712D584|nr:hypothetical protein [Hymenobacter sp. CA2-7]MDO7886511.1 hypothetical protein [Hymenobacter sp. CA2-7]
MTTLFVVVMHDLVNEQTSLRQAGKRAAFPLAERIASPLKGRVGKFTLVVYMLPR